MWQEMEFEYFTVFKPDTSHTCPASVSVLMPASANRSETRSKPENARRFGVSRRTVYDYKKRLDEAAFYSRSKVLTVRLHPKDLDELDALAGRLGRSRADIARAVLLRAVDVFQPDLIETEEISALTKQLAPIGQNLNQLVRALNMANARNGVAVKPEAEAEMLKVGREIEQMAQTARRLLLRRAQIQRTRNEEIFKALGAPERPQEALGAPERPAETPMPRRSRLAALIGLHGGRGS